MALAQSGWVRPGPDGRLIYRTTASGDRIMDFSYAGYRGGGVALPRIDEAASLSSSGGDDTGAVQTAIDATAAHVALDARPRAVVLRAGTYHLTRPLMLKTGVVLRGEGSDRTMLVLAGDPHVGVIIGHPVSETSLGDPIAVTDGYIPSGATHIHVSTPGTFGPGDAVRITAPVTDAWIRFMGMDALSRGGKPQVWLKGSLSADRVVRSVQGDTVELTPPLSDSYDARYFGEGAVRLTRIDQQGLTMDVGLEDLAIIAPARHVALDQPLFTGLVVDGTQDFWVRNVSITDMTNDVEVGRDTRRGTFENVATHHAVRIVGAAKPFGFSLTGTQILIDRSSVQGDAIWYVATNRDVQGPNVVLHCRFDGTGAVEPHQRWATGFLVDGVDVPRGGIAFQNRGAMGSGHGWTVGWSVSWNNRAAWLVIQNPPGALNWSIGDHGDQRRLPMPTFPQDKDAADEPPGIIERPDAPVMPRSLYLAQLKERLGPDALRAIGCTDADAR